MVIGTRMAAAPKQMSGIAVTMPVEASSSAWPDPSVPNDDEPVITSQPR